MGQTRDTVKEGCETAFLVFGALVGAVGCLTRPDYNLPIFLFTYVITKYFTKGIEDDKDQFFCLILMAWSFAIDALFFIFVYGEVWDTTAYHTLAKFEDGLHTMAVICVAINACVKLGYIIFKCTQDAGKLWQGFKYTFCCCCFKETK